MSDTAGTRDRTPTVFRRGTVVTMNDARDVLRDADLLVLGDRIADVGRDLDVPPGTLEIDASGGILMPGMIDSHRHMWQTVVRGLGSDWTLSRYFEWFTRHRDAFRPEDVHAGNLLSALEAFEAGVTTTVDWSNGLQTVDHADAAVDALEQAHGRFVLAYGNMFGPATDWASTRRFRDFVDRRLCSRDEIGLQLAIDVTGDPGFPERPAFAVRRAHRGHVRERRDGRDERLRPRRDTLRRLLPEYGRHGRDRLDLRRERAARGPGLPPNPRRAEPRHPDRPVRGHQPRPTAGARLSPRRH